MAMFSSDDSSNEGGDVVEADVQLKTRHPYFDLIVCNGQSGGIS